MQNSFLKKLGALALGVSAATATGCESRVAMNVELTTPCDAPETLSGINSYRVSLLDGDELVDGQSRDVSANSTTSLSAGLAEGLSVRIHGFPGTTPSGAPTVTGASVPLNTSDSSVVPDEVTVKVRMGLADSFGSLWDPAQPACQALPAAIARHAHSATYIPSIGKVLLAGGAVQAGADERFVDALELFDPATGTVEALDLKLNAARAYHSAVASKDGRVLLTGGMGEIDGAKTALITAEILDFRGAAPSSKTISMRTPRVFHTATYLAASDVVVLAGGCAGGIDVCGPDGVVSVGGGDPTNLAATIEIFDFENETSTAVVESNGLISPRALHAASVVKGPLGPTIVFTGGVDADGCVADIEVFEYTGNPSDKATPGPGANILSTCVAGHAQVSPSTEEGPDVLLIGGYSQMNGGKVAGDPSNLLQNWNTNQGLAPAASAMLVGRAGHQAFTMDHASVIVIGGRTAGDSIVTAERIKRAGAGFLPEALAGRASLTARAYAAAVRLPGNQVFVSGGRTTSAPVASSAVGELYFGKTSP